MTFPALSRPALGMHGACSVGQICPACSVSSYLQLVQPLFRGQEGMIGWGPHLLALRSKLSRPPPPVPTSRTMKTSALIGTQAWQGTQHCPHSNQAIKQVMAVITCVNSSTGSSWTHSPSKHGNSKNASYILVYAVMLQANSSCNPDKVMSMALICLMIACCSPESMP